MAERVGFIGLGNLGGHLAHSLVLAGFDVVVNDLDRRRADSLVAEGATWAETPREVAGATGTVITCLPSPAAVTAVLTGEDGALAGLAPGGTWIEMSTNDREEIQRLASLCQARGVSCLEAPVTGGVHMAAQGEITVLVGGDEHVYAEHSAIFAAVGRKTVYMGGLGNASIIKVITNMLAFVHLVAAGEALMLAKAGGLDLATSFEAIRASSGNSFVFETEGQVVLNGSYNIGFTIDLACKDLGFATAMGAEFSVPLDLATRVEETFERARAEYGGSDWSPKVVKLLEEAVGQDLRAPGFPEVLVAGVDGRNDLRGR